MYCEDLAHVHDTAYSGDAARAAPRIVQLLRGRGIDRGLIVEMGCGSGITASALVDAGYDVLGIDLSPAMIRLARARAPGATFRVGRLDTAALPPCAAVLAIGEVVTYVPPGCTPRAHERTLGRFFSRVFGALQPGGVFVFDFMASAKGRTYAHRSTAAADWTIDVSARVDRSGRNLTRAMTIRRTIGGRTRVAREVHRIRVYPAAAIRRLVTSAGFTVALRRSIGRVKLMAGDLAAIALKPSC